MKAVLEKSYDLRPNDFNCYGKLTPSAILDIFQDMAGRHSIIMGADLESLKKKGLFWVVAKIRFEFLGEAKMYQTVKVKTWPLKPSRVTFRRECLISDLEGNPIVRGSTEWVVVDTVKRRIASSDGVYSLNDGDYLEEVAFDDRISKVPTFEASGNAFKICPRFSDFDVNGHVNNTKYAAFAFDALAESENKLDFNYFQIDYHKEVLSGEELSIYIKKESDRILFLGKGEGETKFSCFIK